MFRFLFVAGHPNIGPRGRGEQQLGAIHGFISLLQIATVQSNPIFILPKAVQAVILQIKITYILDRAQTFGHKLKEKQNIAKE